MSELRPESYTVTQITEEITQLLSDSLGSVSVEGEISGWKVASSGHAYFSLKDEKSLIKAVMWRSRLERATERPADGQLVRAHGKVTVYAPRGDYQLDVTSISQAGVGLLLQQFEKLKLKLAEEGLFEAERKLPPPFHLRRVVAITSPTGAAIQDFLRVLRSRGTPVEILILPVRVQGVGAAAEIAGAIEKSRDLEPDLVLVTRGGGSLEDLWSFNEEIVARAIADCPIPLVSAVGHEVDYTISDFVADLRTPTPTAGAHLIADLVEGLFENYEDKRERIFAAFSENIRQHRIDLNLLHQRLLSESPLSFVPHYRQRVDETLERCGRALGHRLQSDRRDVREKTDRLRGLLQSGILRLRSDLRVKSEMLTAYNPKHTLDRGFARVETAQSNRPVRKKNEVPNDEDIRIELADGTIEATPHR